MDVQLQELIDKIKKDGVTAAKTSAEEIISEAEENAKKIVSDAQAQAEKIIKNAKAETERMEKASEDAIKQAGRNLLLISFIKDFHLQGMMHTLKIDLLFLLKRTVFL